MRRSVKLALLALGSALAWLSFRSARVGPSAEPFVHARASELPSVDVALVLGCSEHLADGRRNLFFDTRIQAAAELIRAQKVSYLLVSGDNSRAGYDEPTAMLEALVKKGVARQQIVRDYAGFRTLDSVVRAKDVFGLSRVIVVSQHFHAVRAVYLARANGLEAYGFDARAVGGAEGFWVGVREVFSRAAAVLDTTVLHTRPRFSGPPETTPF